jgi:prevent-host-death family protein
MLESIQSGQIEDKAMIKWQLQDAKNRFSELVRKAREEGPQVVTLHGRDAVVVVSTEEFNKHSRLRGSLADFFRKSPLAGLDLDLKRDRDTGRKVDL